MATSGVIDIAERFVSARRANFVLDEYPGAVPETLDEAYALQDAAIVLRGGSVGGWKVGRVPDRDIEGFGAVRLAGPIFADAIVHAGDVQTVTMPILDGFAAVEAELLMRIATGRPLGSKIEDRIDEVRFGIEIASSPFRGINEHGPAVTVSDFGNNYGLVLGPVVEDWRSRDLLSAKVTMAIDGVRVGEGSTATMLDGPFGAVMYLLELLEHRGIDVAPGTWVSTGAITGVHRALPGQVAIACFDNRETVGVELKSAPSA